MRILIAEDDLTSRNMLAGMLLKYGHEVDYTGGTRFRLRFVPKIACIYE